MSSINSNCGGGGGNSGSDGSGSFIGASNSSYNMNSLAQVMPSKADI
jgi:hypothetical protein